MKSTAPRAQQAMVKKHTPSDHVSIEDLYDGVPAAGKAGQKMGAGGTATVYKITQKDTGKEFACKIVKMNRVKDKAKRDMLMQEIDIIKMLDHPNIVKIHEVFVKINEVYIVMELCTGGELFDKLYDQPAAKFTEADARFLAEKGLSALAYLHTNNIAHRDLKLENFIFDTKEDDAEMKLIDFGFSRQYLEGKGHEMHDTVGTCYYLAPEVITKNYTEASDLWSFGVVFYMLITGECPFGGDDNATIIRNIRKKVKNPAEMRTYFSGRLAGMHISDDTIDFTMGLLTVNPDERLTAESALEHPYIKDVGGVRLPRQSLGEHLTAVEHDERESHVVANIIKFKQIGELKRAALLAVSVGIDTAELHSLNATFHEADENQDGLISLAEFQKMMAKHGHSKPEIESAFAAIDQDHQGVIKYTEFIAAALEEKAYQAEENVLAAFHKLDLDDTGSITIANLKKLFPEDMDDAHITEMLNQFDENGDGKIDLAEFQALMSGMEVSAAGGPMKVVSLKREVLL